MAHLPRAEAGQRLLDVACGGGRHLRYALSLGYAVTGIDRDLKRIADLTGQPGVTSIEADLEAGQPAPFAGERYNVVLVTNYLWRPLLPDIVAAVVPDGLLIYETFARGNEAYGRPSNPDFLLEPGELLDAVRAGGACPEGRCLRPIAYENGLLLNPHRVVQRIVAAGTRRTVSIPLGD